MKTCEEKITNKPFYSESKTVEKKPPKDTVKNLFNEYRLQDQVDALKYTSGINEASEKATRKFETIRRNVKDQGSVKDCLRSKESTPFQLLMAELKSTTVDSYWNKEIGKNQVPNLPAGMDPVKTTFGKIRKPDGSVAEVINPSTDFSFDTGKGSAEHRIYLKSHNDYYPSEQINRAYETPFNIFHQFGKPSGANCEGKRIKKLMAWINPDPVSKVSCLQADFYNCAQPQVSEVKNAKASSLLMNCTFGKRSEKKAFGVSETLKECLPINPQLSKIIKSLEDVNKLRIILKKRGISFSNIEEKLHDFDEKNLKSVHIHTLLDVLTKFKIFPKIEFFCELLKVLKISENDRVNYKEAINLLNWNCDFPEIPKLEALNSTYYATTYDTIGNIRPNHDSAKDLIKESRVKNHQSTLSALITPNIFTQYGLSNDDLLKPHSKKAIFSILEKIEDIPKEKFDSFWEDGCKIDGTGGVCILTIKSLLDKFIIEMD